jgi:thiopeptide-type bacteriocin biosynthesis protein
MSEYGWLSIYLYYEEPFETLLLKGVKPFLDPMLEMGMIQRYFFIRYYEDGPHIRLRLRGEKDILENLVLPNLKDHFERYFRLEPTVRTFENEHWFPNNEYKVSEYMPEIARYGGDFGVTVAEKQFFLSSQVVFKVFEKYGEDNWSDEYAMGEAMQLNVAMAFACGFSLEETIHFFNFFYEHWIHASVHQLHLAAEDVASEKLKWTMLYEENFLQNRDIIVNQNAALWQILTEKSEFQEDYMNEWILGNQQIYKDLDAAFESGYLSPRGEKYTLKTQFSMSAKQKLIWSMLCDYVHMTNNRLGISTDEEAFLAYLIKQSLSELM